MSLEMVDRLETLSPIEIEIQLASSLISVCLRDTDSRLTHHLRVTYWSLTGVNFFWFWIENTVFYLFSIIFLGYSHSNWVFKGS